MCAREQDTEGNDGQSTNHPDRARSAADTSESPSAPIESLEQIGSKWRLIVLNDLQEGEKRFNELKKSTEASARTLSRVLDDLQEMGFVDRRIEEDAPVATYYSLTPRGTSLCPVFEAIGEWAAEWIGAPGPEN